MKFNSKIGAFGLPEERFICAFGITEALGAGALFTAGATEAALTIPAATAAFTAADAVGLGALGLGAAGAAGAFSGSAAAAPAASGAGTTIPSDMVQPVGFSPSPAAAPSAPTLPTAALSSPTGTPFGSPTAAGPSAAGTALPPGAASPDLATFTPQTLPQISAEPFNVSQLSPGIDTSPISSGNSITDAFANPSAHNILHAAGENAGPLVAGVGLARDMLAPQTIPQSGQLTSQANQLTNQGTQLQSYLTSGTLPPGVKTAIDTATKSAQAAIRSKYASMGMAGSTAETQELSQASLSAQNQGTSIALQLLQTGIDEVGLSSRIYETLMGANNQQNAATGSAIANLAGALGGGVRVPVGNSSVTING